MSLSPASAFRNLLRVAADTELRCQFPRPGGVFQYARARWREEAYLARHQPPAHAADLIERSAVFELALEQAATNDAIKSTLSALSLGTGNREYLYALEKQLLDRMEFEEERQDRDEVDDESSSEHQNRILQVSCAPYAARLAAIEAAIDGSLAEIRTAASSKRASATTTVLDAGDVVLVVELDDELNKQVVFVTAKDGFDWDAPVERLEVSEVEALRGTTMVAERSHQAFNLWQSVLEESAVHRSRGTVFVGHGVGGALATGMALYAHGDDFDVRNTITFGAPKILESVLRRHVAGINALRLVVAGDPLIELPITGAEGQPFIHVGEILVLEAEGKTSFTAAEYSEVMQDQSVPLLYAEGDEVWDAGDVGSRAFTPIVGEDGEEAQETDETMRGN